MQARRQRSAVLHPHATAGGQLVDGGGAAGAAVVRLCMGGCQRAARVLQERPRTGEAAAGTDVILHVDSGGSFVIAMGA